MRWVMSECMFFYISIARALNRLPDFHLHRRQDIKRVWFKISRPFCYWHWRSCKRLVDFFARWCNVHDAIWSLGIVKAVLDAQDLLSWISTLLVAGYLIWQGFLHIRELKQLGALLRSQPDCWWESLQQTFWARESENIFGSKQSHGQDRHQVLATLWPGEV